MTEKRQLIGFFGDSHIYYPSFAALSCVFHSKQYKIVNVFGILTDSLSISLKVLRDRKLDRVGPIDNRPSTDKLHQFVTCDT